MEKVVNRMVEYMVADGEWSELDRMKMRLGFQVLSHNVWMTAVILSVAWFIGVLKEAVVLYLAFGMLKMNMGGLHFQTSLRVCHPRARLSLVVPSCRGTWWSRLESWWGFISSASLFSHCSDRRERRIIRCRRRAM